jgi:hypothetical protein
MSEVVAIAGMIRSGSTWLFNAARLLAGDEFEAAGWHADLPERDGKFLVKLHAPSEGWASRARLVLTTRRDLRDVAASLIAMDWGADLSGAIDAAVEAHQWWADRSALEIPYEQIVGSPLGVLKSLAAVLGVRASDQVFDDVAMALSAMPTPEGSSYDKTTLLHPGHRTGGGVGRWRSDLSAPVLNTIMLKHGDWLMRYSYV